MQKVFNSNDLEDEIFDIVTDLLRDDLSKGEAIEKLLILFDTRISLFQKNRLDILNWAKSELRQETNPKLGKIMTSFRSDRVVFLLRIIKWINNGG